MQIRLKTRGYELDRSGGIPPAQLLRYMEHLRWLSLEEESWALMPLFEEGRAAVVVAQRASIFREIGVGVELVCSMSLGRVGRASMELVYDLRTADCDEAVAQALVSLVQVDADGAPTPLPDTVRQRPRPDETMLDPASMDLPEPPGEEAPADGGTWTVSFPVRPSDLDLLRHVNHAKYVDYFEDVRFTGAANRAYGEHSHLASLRARRVAVEYRGQAVFGDHLTVKSWPLRGARPRPGFGFELRREGESELLSRARIEVE
jgi:acyl-CoA thioesterase FadM